MSNDDYDDIDETADPVDDDSEDDTEVLAAVDTEAEGGEAAPSEADGPVARTDIDDAETLTVSSKESLRRQLEEEMERFLAQGGKIKEIPPDESADPPRKPVSSYGSKPI
jgi:hypothetical protein